MNYSTGQTYSVSRDSSVPSGDYTWSGYNIKIEPYHSNGAYLRYYMIRIYDGEELVREYVPGEKDGYGWCLYDNVTGEYLYNQSQKPWLKTDTPDWYIGTINPPAGRVMKVDGEMREGDKIYERLVNIRDESDVLRGNFLRNAE